PYTSGGSLFLNLLEESPPVDMPALLGERTSTTPESLAIKADTPTVPSARTISLLDAPAAPMIEEPKEERPLLDLFEESPPQNMGKRIYDYVDDGDEEGKN
ncbi:hypothetical protein HAX54_006616, partial [Datura stramonium]|nr:hypothetical protein [Datura stramonium]